LTAAASTSSSAVKLELRVWRAILLVSGQDGPGAQEQGSEEEEKNHLGDPDRPQPHGRHSNKHG
jgi:hypothetical protein